MARRQSDEERRRLKASREIGQGYRLMRSIRALYLILGVLTAVLGLVALLNRDIAQFRSMGGQAFVLFVGASQVREKPGPWSFAMAVMISLIAGVMLWGGPSTLGLWGAAIAISMWCVLPLTFRVQKLLRRYPDLYIAQKWQGKRTAQMTERSQRIHAETRRQKRESRIKWAVLIGAFVLFGVAIKFGPDLLGGDEPEYTAPAVPEFGTRAEDFRDAWNNKGWDDIVEFLPPRDRKRRGPRVQRLMIKRGWDKQRPKLVPPHIEDDRGYRKAIYGLVGFETDLVFTVYWDAGETQWWWAKTKWPKAELVRR